MQSHYYCMQIVVYMHFTKHTISCTNATESSDLIETWCCFLFFFLEVIKAFWLHGWVDFSSFDQGLSRAEIVLSVSDRHFQISPRHLRWRIQLYRCRHYSDYEHMVNLIASQLEGTGHLYGNRMMFDRCWFNGLQLCLFIYTKWMRVIYYELDDPGYTGYVKAE